MDETLVEIIPHSCNVNSYSHESLILIVFIILFNFRKENSSRTLIKIYMETYRFVFYRESVILWKTYIVKTSAQCNIDYILLSAVLSHYQIGGFHSVRREHRFIWYHMFWLLKYSIRQKGYFVQMLKFICFHKNFLYLYIIYNNQLSSPTN